MKQTKTVMRGCVGCDVLAQCPNAYTYVSEHCDSYDRTEIEVPVVAQDNVFLRAQRGRKAFDAILHALSNDDGVVSYWTDGESICCEDESVANTIAAFVDALFGKPVASVVFNADKSDHYCIKINSEGFDG